MRHLGALIAVALVGVLVGAGSVAGVSWLRGGSDRDATTSVVDPVTAVTQRINGDASTAALLQVRADDFSSLYRAVRPSIVEIDITGQTGRRRSQQVQGLGSGVVLDVSGDILTNNHVISGSQTISIIFADGATASATVLGTDLAHDLAILKTDANVSELHPATLGDAGTLKIGNVVGAVGNPFGLQGTFTTGVISGLDRTLAQSGQRGLLQTEAAINEGSSGGGLFDLQGELIGINSALENPDANTFVGVGYAVPINTAKRLIQRLVHS